MGFVRFDPGMAAWPNTRGSSDVALHDILYVEQIAKPTCERQLCGVVDSVVAGSPKFTSFSTPSDFLMLSLKDLREGRKGRAPSRAVVVTTTPV